MLQQRVFYAMRDARTPTYINVVMVAVKIVALVLFCAVGFTGFRSGNYADFMPLGMAGVSAAGATLFFSYIGFDAASTAGEEAKDPKKDLPRAIMLSLIIVTALYVLVAGVAVGAWHWTKFEGSQASLAAIMNDEPFGPVAVSRPFDTFEEAIEQANRLPYGLAAFAFTENGRRANLIGDLVESGMVGINTFAISGADAPFGGVKDSGFGSEGGKEGLESYQVVKAVHQA